MASHGDGHHQQQMLRAVPSREVGNGDVDRRRSGAGAHIGSENLAPAARGKAEQGSRIGDTLGDITNIIAGRAGTGLNKLSKPLGDCFAQQQQQQQQQERVAQQRQDEESKRRREEVAPRQFAMSQESSFDAAFLEDSKDVQKVSEYASEIHERLFEDEAKLRPRPNYMESQPEVSSKMRGILLDWLVEVHQKYRLRPETLFLAQYLIDHYLSVRTILRKRLQLLGVTCTFIAAKFEEINPPKASDFAYITNNTYTKDDILKLECVVLSALDFDIVVPTPVHFFDRLVRASGGGSVHASLVQYVLELTITDITLIRHAPSHMVSAAILLSNELLRREPVWPAAMEHHSHYRESDLRTCANELRVLWEGAATSSLQAVRRKFQLEFYCKVADMTFPSTA
mmetsp:Transcript_94796/g.247419  ORF Transcript_94796/g.247419 Transcript_94796/m.247419 type:complete len:398 (+) Transcript_94796:108-1301(+)